LAGQLSTLSGLVADRYLDALRACSLKENLTSYRRRGGSTMQISRYQVAYGSRAQ
jgi:hypothetical protein